MGRSRELAELASAYDGGSLGFRNRIINGDMRIDQRNAGAAVTPADFDFITDRWQVRQSTASKMSAGRSTTAPVGFTNSLLITSLSAYSVGASDIYVVRQQIEGFNTADLGWGTANAQTVTLSFWVRSSLTGTFGGSFLNAGNNRSYVFTYTISAANTWEYKTITVAGDTTGTWATDNTRGIQVSWGLGVGTTQSGTPGAWSGVSYASATGAVSVVGTNGATFYITGVQLEAGSVATPFERRPYGTELALCQRYFQIYNNATGFSSFGAGRQTTSTATRIFANYPTMRTSPTAAYSGTVNIDIAGTVVLVSSITAQYLGVSSGFIDFANAAGGAAGAGAGLQFSAGLGNFLSLSSEL